MVLASVCLCTWLLVNGTLPNVALRAIGEGVDASFSDIQWLLSAYTLCLASLQLTAGNLADLFGRKRLLLIGLALFTISSALAAAAPSPQALIAARVAQGIGAATLFPASLAVLAQAFEGGERARAIGIRGIVVGIAYGFGSLVGGLAVTVLGWWGVFLALAVVGVPTFVLCLRHVEESRDPRPAPVDLPGVVTLSAGLALVVFGLVRVNVAGWASAQVLGALVAGAAVLCAFVVIERRVRHPMVELDQFAIPAFAGASAVTLLTGAAVIAVLAYVTIDLLVVVGGTPLQVGIWLLPLGLVGIAAAATSRVARTFQLGYALAGSMAVCAVGLLALRGIRADSTWLHFVPGLLIVGAGLGLAQPLGTIAHLGVLPPSRHGLASGVNNTSRQIGITLGFAGLGTLLHGRLLAYMSQVPEPLREQLASGNLANVLASQPEASRAALKAAYSTAYASALDDVLLVAAGLAALSAVVAAVTVRQRDMRGEALAAPAAA